MKVLVDASTLIALAKIGEIGILKELFGEISITPIIRSEIIKKGFPETDVLEDALNDWIKVVDYRGDMEELKKYGLDDGEASLFCAFKGGDRLIIDEGNARRIAQVRAIPFTGLLGLLIAAVKAKKIEKDRVIKILKKLAQSDFRVSGELYSWMSSNTFN
jgi:predicted nucleic acid-binding protein